MSNTIEWDSGQALVELLPYEERYRRFEVEKYEVLARAAALRNETGTYGLRYYVSEPVGEIMDLAERWRVKP